MRILVNASAINFSQNLGVWLYSKRLLDKLSLRVDLSVVVGLESRKQQLLDDLNGTIPVETIKECVPSEYDIELQLHHLQQKLTTRASVLNLYDFHVWDVAWKYENADELARLIAQNAKQASAVFTQFPRTFYDFAEFIPGCHSNIFLTDSPGLSLPRDPTSEVAETRGRLNVHPGEKLLLYPAQLQLHKNHKNLIGAISLLRQSGAPVRLVCPGTLFNEGVSEQIQRMPAEFGCADAVQFLGRVSDDVLADLYRACDLVVSSSFAEGGAYLAWEAAQYGKPCALSNLRSVELHARHLGLVPTYFDPGSSDTIAVGLRLALEPGEVARQAAIRPRPVSSWDEHCDFLVEIFRWVAASCPPSRMPRQFESGQQDFGADPAPRIGESRSV